MFAYFFKNVLAAKMLLAFLQGNRKAGAFVLFTLVINRSFMAVNKIFYQVEPYTKTGFCRGMA